MKQMALVGLMVGAAVAWFLPGPAAARALVVLTDPNCVARLWELPASLGVDPNAIEGQLLPLDPNAWEVPAGKFNRIGLCCDPEGDPFDVTVLSGTTAATVVCDPDAGQWTLSVEVIPGLNLWTVQALDRPLYGAPQRSVWTVLAMGVAPPNTEPTLY